jgi:hypothetical protein
MGLRKYGNGRIHVHYQDRGRSLAPSLDAHGVFGSIEARVRGSGGRERVADGVALIDNDRNRPSPIEPAGQCSPKHDGNGASIGAREVDSFSNVSARECHAERNATP